MRVVGLSLGLALLCLLRAEAAGPGAAGLDKSEFEGRWNIIALASNSERYLQRKDELKMVMTTIKVLENGDLKVSYAMLTPEGCRKFESIYKPTGTPGEYHSSDRGNRKVQVVDTDGRSYAVIFASREEGGKTLHMLRLYSRAQEASPQITALFKKRAREKSFTDEMIQILPRQDECVPEGA